MPGVTVRFLGQIREATGADQILIEVKDSPTMAELVDVLQERFGEKFSSLVNKDTLAARQSIVTIIVNGENIAIKNGLSTLLSNGDIVAMLTTIAGGNTLH